MKWGSLVAAATSSFCACANGCSAFIEVMLDQLCHHRQAVQVQPLSLELTAVASMKMASRLDSRLGSRP